MFAGNFPPAGWAFCNGAPQAISENDALFTVIGTTYGGDGQETFNLPNLQSRVPMHQGTNAGQTFSIGETGGVETVTLTTQQIPLHTHAPLASGAGAASQSPASNVAAVGSGQIYSSANSPTALNPQAISAVGGSQPHENVQPYLCINFIISLFGVFPAPQ